MARVGPQRHKKNILHRWLTEHVARKRDTNETLEGQSLENDTLYVSNETLVLARTLERKCKKKNRII